MGPDTSVGGRSRRTWLLAVIPVVAVVAAAATFAFGSSSSGGSGSAAAAGHEVTIMNFSFSPSTLTVKPGTKVTVFNRDGTTHTLTADGGAFNTGQISGGTGSSFTAPTKPGTYQYRCDIHQYMHGVLTVS